MAKREALQRELFRQVVWAQEEERWHIARELHDQASQSLTALSRGLAAAEDALPHSPKDARQQIGNLMQLTEQVGDELRQLTAGLRLSVLDDLGLVAALITYADDCSARFPFMVDVGVIGERRRLSPDVETTLYRITQEAITNVVRHARASYVAVRLAFHDQELTFSVRDDGEGMNVEIAQHAASSA